MLSNNIKIAHNTIIQKNGTTNLILDDIIRFKQTSYIKYLISVFNSIKTPKANSKAIVKQALDPATAYQ